MHAWKIILGALHPLHPVHRVPMKFSAQTPSPRTRAHGHDPKGLHSYSCVLGTIRSVAVVDHDHDHDDANGKSEERGGGKGSADSGDDGGRGIDMHLGSVVVATGCRKRASTRPRTRNLSKWGNLSRGIFLFRGWGGRGSEGMGGREGRQRGKKLVLSRRRFREYREMIVWSYVGEGERDFHSRGWNDSIDSVLRCWRAVSMRI